MPRISREGKFVVLKIALVVCNAVVAFTATPAVNNLATAYATLHPKTQAVRGGLVWIFSPLANMFVDLGAAGSQISQAAALGTIIPVLGIAWCLCAPTRTTQPGIAV